MSAALHVMSFNVRHDNGRTRPGEPDHWPEREPLVTALLARDRPDLLGVQEPEFPQLPALLAGLGPAYEIVGYGREGGSDGEYSAILYDTERLELEAWDQLWLSDTPRVIASTTWGNETPRVLVWARLRDRVTDTVFLHVNSHFDHQSEEACVRSAAMVSDLIADAGLPAVFTADANAAAEHSAAYDVMTAAGLQDSWLAADERLTPRVGTFPHYGEPVPAGRRIDWILATPDVAVVTASIDTWRKDGRWPSDHAPVRAVLRLR